MLRSEWDELYARYRLLEERCIRLEKLVLQLHPELTENPPYEAGAAHPATVSSLAAQRPVPARLHPLAGSSISGSGANPRAGNQHITPNTPLSALPGPGPSPRHGPSPVIPSYTVSSSVGAENSASSRSGSDDVTCPSRYWVHSTRRLQLDLERDMEAVVVLARCRG